MTDLTSELVTPLHEARAWLREAGPAGIHRALPLFAHVIRTLSSIRDAGEPLSDSSRAIVADVQRETAAISVLLDRAALLHSAVLQGLTDRSRRDSAAVHLEL